MKLHRVSIVTVVFAIACNGLGSPDPAVEGYIIDEQAQPLAGARLTVVGRDDVAGATAGADGHFTLSDASLLGDTVFRAAATGYGTSYVLRTMESDVPQWITVTLKAETAAQTVVLPAAGQSITITQDFLDLTIPGGALCHADGAEVTGSISVMMIPYDARDLDAIPASLLAGVDNLPFATEGMVDMTIMQGSEYLSLCAGKHLMLGMTVAAGLDTSTFDGGFLYLHADTGRWETYPGATAYDDSTRRLDAELSALFPHCIYGGCYCGTWAICLATCLRRPPPPPPPVAVNVTGTVKNQSGRVIAAQVDAVLTGAGSKLTTQSTSSYTLSLGSVNPGGSIAATVAPATIPGLGITPAPSSVSYAGGTTTANFQYCALDGSSCTAGDLCCSSGSTCQDRVCTR